MNTTSIEWTDHTWNPVTGCTKVSQGCKNCYAERMYERFNGRGTFELVHLHPRRLSQPVSWKKPSMIFVNSMSDLFHEAVPFDFIYRIFQVMTDKAPHHIYQVLTKRPARALEFFDWIREEKFSVVPYWCNIWIGVSVEDQKTYDERTELLRQIPAAVHFLSCEPLLGHIKFKPPKIDWVICGGESGQKARPMNPEWVRALRNQCRDAGIPFFFKQWGAWRPREMGDTATCGTFVNKRGEWNDAQVGTFINDLIGINWGSPMVRVGKKHAGCLLDGQTHNAFPPNLKK